MFRASSVAVAVLVLAVGVVSVPTLRARHHDSLPYRTIDYSVGDATTAFSGQGIRLAFRSRVPAMTDLANARNVVEVTVFGAPDVLRRTGFRDLAHAPDCTVAGHLALHWRGNVRAIVNCDLVANDRAWIARVDRALAALR